MKISPLTPSGFGLDRTSAVEDATTRATEAGGKPGQVDGKAPIDPEKLRLAKEFEQIFIRKMLSSLEKSGKSTSGGPSSAGGDAYGSMVVNALAEAVSKGGGIGLAELIARAASQPTAAHPAPAAPPATAPAAGTAPTTATYARPTPAIINNENHDIHNLLKDRKR